MKKNFIIAIAIALIVGAGGFFGGMTFQKSQDSLSGLSGDELTAKLESLGMSGGSQFGSRQTGSGTIPNFNGSMPTDMPSGDFRGGPGMNGGGMTSGEIISTDDDSLTVKQEDGSTTIVYFSSSTEISKTVDGTASDLTDGTSVMISGTSNSDESVTATTIQIRADDDIPQS